MAQGCIIGSIVCYADGGENGSVAMLMGAIIAAFVAHIYFSICSITIVTLHVKCLNRAYDGQIYAPEVEL